MVDPHCCAVIVSVRFGPAGMSFVHFPAAKCVVSIGGRGPAGKKLARRELDWWVKSAVQFIVSACARAMSAFASATVVCSGLLLGQEFARRRSALPFELTFASGVFSPSAQVAPTVDAELATSAPAPVSAANSRICAINEAFCLPLGVNVSSRLLALVLQNRQATPRALTLIAKAVSGLKFSGSRVDTAGDQK